MVDSDDKDQDVFATPSEPAKGDGPAPAEGDSGWDDDVWGDEASPPDKRTVMLVQIGLVVLIVLIVGAVVLVKKNDKKDSSDKASDTSSQTTAAGGGTGDTKDATPQYVWPADVGGRPPAFGTFNDTPADAKGGAAPGVYIWSDYDGWHLWVQNGGDVNGVSGTITGNDNIASANVSPADGGTATKASTVISFDLKGSDPLVGLDFNPGFYAVKLDFAINGPNGPIPAAEIHLGKEMTPATTSPLSIEKVLSN